ncbi:MAG: hypothetical protein ACR2P0_09075 [Acidimicrobiales bacterium]
MKTFSAIANIGDPARVYTPMIRPLARALSAGAAVAVLATACGTTVTDIASSEVTEAPATATTAAPTDAAPEASTDETTAVVDEAPAGSDSVTNGSPAENAEANTANLQSADDARDIEVLTVADGSISSLRDAVDGDRPVLVWFWAPH